MISPFVDDEMGDRHWLDAHQKGYVVNTYRAPNAKYIVPHRSACAQISTLERTNYTTRDYIKICSDSKQELQARAKSRVNGSLMPCRLCAP